MLIPTEVKRISGPFSVFFLAEVEILSRDLSRLFLAEVNRIFGVFSVWFLAKV